MCRAGNHFHNPLKPWDEAKLTDTVWLYEFAKCDRGPYAEEYSNLVWATGFIDKDRTPQDPWVNYTPDLEESTSSDDDLKKRNWWVARNQFFHALTVEDPVQREKYLAETFRTLGYVIHLLQDVAVPAHTRNDSNTTTGGAAHA